MSIARRRGRNLCFPNEFRENLTRNPRGKTDSRQRPSIRPGIFCDRPCFRKFGAGNVRLLAAQLLLPLFLCEPARSGAGSAGQFFKPA
jgi:hypothetical protein